jgi:hypothetical protein
MPYKAKYVRFTLIKKDLYFDGETQIRVSGDAKDIVLEALDKAVEAEVKRQIALLPRNVKGDNKGQLKVQTLKPDMFAPKAAVPVKEEPKKETAPAAPAPATPSKP